MNYEELCEKFKPFLVKMSNYYGNAVGSKYPYVDKEDFYSVGLETIQKKMNTYSEDKSNGKSFENYMLGHIKFAMGAYARTITNKNKWESDTRLYPIEDDVGKELGGVDFLHNIDMDVYMQDSKVVIDCILKPLDDRPRYIVEQLILHDRTMRELSDELGITISYVSRIYNTSLHKIKMYLNKINYMEVR